MKKLQNKLLLILFLIGTVMYSQVTCTPGTAAYATGGTSAYKDQVLWLTWGGTSGGPSGTNGEVLPVNTKSNTTFTLANKQMCFECELVKVDKSLKSYAPGDWSGDSLDDMYNIGGIGKVKDRKTTNDNKLVNGISYTGGTANFTLSCSAKLDNSPYKIKGLVMADAESLATGNKEFLKASGKGQWQVVEMNKITGSAYNISKTNKADKIQEISFSQGNNIGSAAVSFLSFNSDSYTADGKVNIDFSIRGEGTTAIAIGLLVPNADGGDAPQSYGEVYHLIKDVNITSDGIAADGVVVNANTAAFTPGKIIPPADLFLGSMGPDAERAMFFSSDALGDQNNGTVLNEEDAWPLNKKVIYNILPGVTIDIDVPYVSTGATTIAGWIDFNRNGIFDSGERTFATFNGVGKGTQKLSWTVPSDFIKGKTFARLRISSVETDLDTAIGIATDGEVEDHELYIDDPKFTISKSSNATNNIWDIKTSDKKYVIEVTNIATVNSYGTVKVLDYLPAGITPNWQGTYTSNQWTITYAGQQVTAVTTNVINSKATSTFEIPVKVDETLSSNTYTNYASVGGGGDNDYPEPVDPKTCTGSTNHCTSYDVKVVKTIQANDNNYGLVNPNELLKSIIDDDFFNGEAITDLSKFIVTLTGVDADKVIYNPTDGTLRVKQNIAAKTYQFEYTICELGANPDNCDKAIVTLEVRDLKAPTTNGTTVTTTPGTPVSGSVSITPGSGTITGITTPNLPPDVTLVLNTDGTFTVTPGPSYEGGSTIEIDYIVTDSNGLTTTSKIIVNIPEVANIALVKKASLGQFITANLVTEEVNYSFEVKNTGNVTLNNVTISDKMLSTAPIQVTPSTLKPNEIGTASAKLKIELTHYNTGSITNSATTTGTSSNGTVVTDISGTDLTNNTPTVVNLTQQPTIVLIKTSVFNDENRDGSAEIGETITYTFVTTNTGNVTLNNINLSDTFLNISNRNFTPSVLNPGESATMQISYTLLQSDIDLGLVINTAEVEAYDPAGDLVFDISGTTQENDTPTETTLQAEPEIAIIKTANFLDDNNDGTAQIGETIQYNFTIKNTGDTTLYDVIVTDNLPGVVLIGNPITKLEPGETNSTNYSASYTLTLQDIKNGEVQNQAVVTSKTIQGTPVTDKSDHTSFSNNSPTIVYIKGCDLEIFNSLSPNGDGKNDFFYIQGIECYSNNEIEIYNRWGILVYETKGYNNVEKSFKGYSEGRVTMNKSDMLPVGTYFYILKFKDMYDKTHKIQGYLYLNR